MDIFFGAFCGIMYGLMVGLGIGQTSGWNLAVHKVATDNLSIMNEVEVEKLKIIQANRKGL